MKKNRKLIVLAAVLVVAGIAGYAAITGLYPPRTGTEGAIGAASRYQAQQISESDVALQDAKVQAFLQSDVFHKMSTNATFRKQMLEAKSAELLKTFYAKTTLSDGADLTELLDGAGVAELMNDSELLNTVAGDELFQKALKDQEVVELAKKIAASKKSKVSNEATAAELEKISKIMQEAGVSELEKKKSVFNNQAFVELMAKEHATALLDSGDLLELLSDDGLAEMFNDGGLQAELMDQSVVEAMKNAPVEMLSKAINSKGKAGY